MSGRSRSSRVAVAVLAFVVVGLPATSVTAGEQWEPGAGGWALGPTDGYSPLGFDPHPAFKKTRLVAVAWFEHNAVPALRGWIRKAGGDAAAR